MARKRHRMREVSKICHCFLKVLAVSAGLLLPFSSLGADKNEKFAAVGAGIAKCEAFVEARNTKSQEYFMFGGWIDGYLSARNQSDNDTFTLVPWQTLDVLAGFLFDHCKKHPEQAFMRAVMIMSKALESNRLKESSPLVTIKVGELQRNLYMHTIHTLQQTLNEKAYLNQESGQFDEQTRDALSRYQLDMGIKVTGFPDQATLFRLFHH